MSFVRAVHPLTREILIGVAFLYFHRVHTLSISLYQFLSLSLAHTHTHTHKSDTQMHDTHTCTCTHTQTHTHTHTDYEFSRYSAMFPWALSSSIFHADFFLFVFSP